MSSTEEKDLKAGHPPAVKAGGMRVARHRQTSSGEDAPAKPAEPQENNEEEEFEEQPQPEKSSVVISGALTKGDKDFPPEAIKQYHEKPVPAKQNRPPNPQQKHNIQQPR